MFSCAGAVSSSNVRCSMDPKVLITIFLCGDVMIGRGIDQILPNPGDPSLHEPYVRAPGLTFRLPRKRTARLPHLSIGITSGATP